MNGQNVHWSLKVFLELIIDLKSVSSDNIKDWRIYAPHDIPLQEKNN